MDRVYSCTFFFCFLGWFSLHSLIQKPLRPPLKKKRKKESLLLNNNYSIHLLNASSFSWRVFTIGNWFYCSGHKMLQNSQKNATKRFATFSCNTFLTAATAPHQFPYCSTFWKWCNKVFVLQRLWNVATNNKFAAVFNKYCNKVRFAAFFKTLL